MINRPTETGITHLHPIPAWDLLMETHLALNPARQKVGLVDDGIIDMGVIDDEKGCDEVGD